jgi:putative ABC transport system ATP-binding protein
MSALACHNLTKVYGRGALAETALSGVTMRFEAGECCMLLGPSGSGKTTFLSIVGCLLSPTGGAVEMDGQPIDYTKQGRLTRRRRKQIGFVFQHAQLLPFLSVFENLNIIGRNAGLPGKETKTRIAYLLEHLGIARYSHRNPDDLSGGQRQRVSIARALLHRPKVILADEPTAALDWENGQAATKMLVQQAHNDGALLIVVSHDTRLVPLFDRTVHLESGKLRTA